jgi:hypothetical protein
MPFEAEEATTCNPHPWGEPVRAKAAALRPRRRPGRGRGNVAGGALGAARDLSCERHEERVHQREDHEHVDAANGLSGPSVVSCDNVTTIPAEALRDQIGVLLDDQERRLSDAIRAAFDLE